MPGATPDSVSAAACGDYALPFSWNEYPKKEIIDPYMGQLTMDNLKAVSVSRFPELLTQKINE